jgi:hypothetical protein
MDDGALMNGQPGTTEMMMVVMMMLLLKPEHFFLQIDVDSTPTVKKKQN